MSDEIQHGMVWGELPNFDDWSQYLKLLLSCPHIVFILCTDVTTAMSYKTSSGTSPMLTFCEALISTVHSYRSLPNEFMSQECVQCALNENRLDLVAHWISQERCAILICWCPKCTLLSEFVFLAMPRGHDLILICLEKQYKKVLKIIATIILTLMSVDPDWRWQSSLVIWYTTYVKTSRIAPRSACRWRRKSTWTYVPMSRRWSAWSGRAASRRLSIIRARTSAACLRMPRWENRKIDNS